jgi:cytoplasmic polyadenylation element-binding protein
MESLRQQLDRITVEEQASSRAGTESPWDMDFHALDNTSGIDLSFLDSHDRLCRDTNKFEQLYINRSSLINTSKHASLYEMDCNNNNSSNSISGLPRNFYANDSAIYDKNPYCNYESSSFGNAGRPIVKSRESDGQIVARKSNKSLYSPEPYFGYSNYLQSVDVTAPGNNFAFSTPKQTMISPIEAKRNSYRDDYHDQVRTASPTLTSVGIGRMGNATSNMSGLMNRMLNRTSLANASTSGSTITQDLKAYLQGASTAATERDLVGQQMSSEEERDNDIERAAIRYRNSASSISLKYGGTSIKWSGHLPDRNYRNSAFSNKVFLGGVPWECKSEDLVRVFGTFGRVSIIWPQRQSQERASAFKRLSGSPVELTVGKQSSPKGYCYIVYEHEECVKTLLRSCIYNQERGATYFRLTYTSSTGGALISQRSIDSTAFFGETDPSFGSTFNSNSMTMVTKDIQVIPWPVNDSVFVGNGAAELNGETLLALTGSNPTVVDELKQYSPTSAVVQRYTVFVGALHGMITAEALAKIMQELFGEVLVAVLDTDKFRYPIGSGRVTFRHFDSYVNAVVANFVEVRTAKFTKTIQIDPFLGDAKCSRCDAISGSYFCRSFKCFRYFCRACWRKTHNAADGLCSHKPLRRSLRQPLGFSPIGYPSNSSSAYGSLINSLCTVESPKLLENRSPTSLSASAKLSSYYNGPSKIISPSKSDTTSDVMGNLDSVTKEDDFIPKLATLFEAQYRSRFQQKLQGDTFETSPLANTQNLEPTKNKYCLEHNVGGTKLSNVHVPVSPTLPEKHKLTPLFDY